MSSERKPAGPRCVALIGPQSAGKTSLAEALLNAAGATPRKGTIKEGNTVGDSSDEARARQMSTEINLARYSYLGEDWSLLDCPGAVELSHQAETALMVADAAIALELGQVLADTIPTATIEVMPGGSHAANMTHPAETNAAIQAFMTSLA